VNKAFQVAKMNGVPLISYAGGPNIKRLQYGWQFRYSIHDNKSSLELSNQEK
jgi:hypothetical protein